MAQLPPAIEELPGAGVGTMDVVLLSALTQPAEALGLLRDLRADRLDRAHPSQPVITSLPSTSSAARNS